ncbi:leucine-rich repeat-containing protein 57-like [Anneissia japonica]|uniref:leucine-rich repeat-containing protein 57-like n=1 Tax=Anneissia japonica TaxID=1529436 RepID=UPI001425626D|nr:leucine-rich repeat-containing protein 57-like [Anneissia japonica]
MGNSINPHLERAEKTGVCQLNDMGISQFPPQLQKLTKNLRTLDLSKNKLTVVPSSIGSFEHLKYLTINHNRLGNIPDEVQELKKLENLSLTHNNISTFPSSVSRLTSLRKLLLSANKLKAFPLQVCQLKNLDFLDLSQNLIASVPDGIGDLKAVEVNLNQNQISTLSDSLASCPRLKVLRIEENCLPLSAFTSKILTESSISTLAVDGNLFEMKQFNLLPGYEKYMERYTASKKKMY